jgi:hypothetical protein
MKKNNLPLNETGDLTVFKVPDKFFENFEAQLNQRLDIMEAEKDLTNKKAQVERRPKRYILTMESVKPILSMAAMFVLLLFSVSMILNITSKKNAVALSTEAKKQTENTELTAEDYLISSVGTYGISQYYVDPKSFE